MPRTLRIWAARSWIRAYSTSVMPTARMLMNSSCKLSELLPGVLMLFRGYDELVEFDGID